MSETVIYDGRAIPKEFFRVYIYGFDNQTKLVNSYDEYEMLLTTGLWFDKKENVPSKANPKKKGD